MRTTSSPNWTDRLYIVLFSQYHKISLASHRSRRKSTFCWLVNQQMHIEFLYIRIQRTIWNQSYTWPLIMKTNMAYSINPSIFKLWIIFPDICCVMSISCNFACGSTVYHMVFKLETNLITTALREVIAAPSQIWFVSREIKLKNNKLLN